MSAHSVKKKLLKLNISLKTIEMHNYNEIFKDHVGLFLKLNRFKSLSASKIFFNIPFFFLNVYLFYYSQK